MENIINNVTKKMKTTYSFTGTQLLVTGVGVIILLGIFASASTKHGGQRDMMNHNMNGGNQKMMQQYDRKSSTRDSQETGDTNTVLPLERGVPTPPEVTTTGASNE